MIYNLDYKLTIGQNEIKNLVKAHSRHSNSEPGGKLTLTLSKYKNADQIQVDDELEFKCGYKETGIKEEFIGIVKEVTEQDKEITVEVRDSMWLCSKHRVNAKKTIWIKKDFDSFLKKVLPSDQGLHWDVELEEIPVIGLSYIHNKTATYALWKLKRARNLDLFWEGKKLIIRQTFAKRKIAKEIPKFIFNYNIVEDDLKLRAGKKIKVTVRGEDKSYIEKNGSRSMGRIFSASYGKGDEMIIDVDSVNSRKDALEQAKTIHKKESGWGFRGSFKTFGFPSVSQSDIIEIIDKADKNRNSKTYVEEIEKTFDFIGANYRQEIWPGSFMKEPR